MSRRRRAARPLSADPLWYKDAVVYQVHVKSFFDSNNDGVGDLTGLTEKLDYISELGATAIWLLPFYPSPRRDDGYDISDYHAVHPEYGTIHDMRRFIAAAHARGLRVITELVVNHTSDQHPWFQRARHAKPGSAWRRFYVWSDNDRAYADARIIFTDTEKIELELRSCGRVVFLASILFAPAGSQLRQSARAPGGARGDAVLARSWRGRIPARRRSLPGRARRNGLREPPRDARRHQAHPRRARPDRPGMAFSKAVTPALARLTAWARFAPDASAMASSINRISRSLLA